MIISKTPLRLSFAGGGTDLPSYYTRNAYGAVLSSSLDKYIYVSVKNHGNVFPESIRLSYSETERVNSLEEIKHPIIRECLRHVKINGRIHISTISDIPGSSGLGSSSAFCVGLLNALYTYLGQKVNPLTLAESAAHIEIDSLRRPIGKQDHYAAAYGGLNYFCFHPDGRVVVSPLKEKNPSSALLFNSLSLFWTKRVRDSSEILFSQDCDSGKNSSILDEMCMQAQNLFSLVEKNKLTVSELGQILGAAWNLKMKLSPKVSNPYINQLYATAMEAGALGGKIAGAGGGGFLAVVSPQEKSNTVVEAMAGVGIDKVDIGPSFVGSEIIYQSS